MINTDMRTYTFYTFGATNAYGEPQLSTEPQGAVLMAINTISQTITDNIKYKDSNYIGLTLDKTLTDSHVIQYGEEKLKVLYVNPKGRYTQVFLKTL